jgi:Ca2+-binding EF-hand superfamily protein
LSSLWRNFEARRKVFAQIVDYAKDLQALSYPDLEKAIRTARSEADYSLFGAVMESADEDAQVDESTFLDAVSRNLRPPSVCLGRSRSQRGLSGSP